MTTARQSDPAGAPEGGRRQVTFPRRLLREIRNVILGVLAGALVLAAGIGLVILLVGALVR